MLGSDSPSLPRVGGDKLKIYAAKLNKTQCLNGNKFSIVSVRFPSFQQFKIQPALCPDNDQTLTSWPSSVPAHSQLQKWNL